MQPIVFLKAIVPFTSSIIDLSADTSSASSLSNGRHPRSSAPFHPSFFFSLWGFSPPFVSRGFQSPSFSWVSVPLRLSWGFSPPSSLWGFSPPSFPWVSLPCGVSVPLCLSWVSFPCGVSPFQSPFVFHGFHSLMGFQSPLRLVSSLSLWAVAPLSLFTPLHTRHFCLVHSCIQPRFTSPPPRHAPHLPTPFEPHPSSLPLRFSSPRLTSPPPPPSKHHGTCSPCHRHSSPSTSLPPPLPFNWHLPALHCPSDSLC
jgi:hypothetical protein